MVFIPRRIPVEMQTVDLTFGFERRGSDPVDEPPVEFAGRVVDVDGYGHGEPGLSCDEVGCSGSSLIRRVELVLGDDEFPVVAFPVTCFAGHVLEVDAVHGVLLVGGGLGFFPLTGWSSACVSGVKPVPS